VLVLRVLTCFNYRWFGWWPTASTRVGTSNRGSCSSRSRRVPSRSPPRELHAEDGGAGETSIEVPDLPVRAVATGRVVWTTALLTKYEEPLRINVASPCP
jgi:hypothetical protein